jgi:hypothetical protein
MKTLTKKVLAGLGVALAMGVAVLPLSNVSALEEDQIITVNVNSVLFLQIAGTTATTLATGVTDTSTLYNDVWGATAGGNGYTLSINAKTANDVNLLSLTGDIIEGTNTVLNPPVSGTGALGSFVGGSYTWGLNATAFTNTGGSAPGTGFDWTDTTSLVAPTTSLVELGSTIGANTTATLANADGYRIRYGVVTANNQPNGAYSATNVFTIVDNN